MADMQDNAPTVAPADHEPVEEVPRADPDAWMVVVYQAHEVLRDTWDIAHVGLEEGGISRSDLHVLEKDSEPASGQVDHGTSERASCRASAVTGGRL